MYMVFATELNSSSKSEPGGISAFDSLNIDDAARQCIELSKSGYTIHKVVLPNGTTIHGEQVDRAIRMGVNSVRIAISRLRA